MINQDTCNEKIKQLKNHDVIKYLNEMNFDFRQYFLENEKSNNYNIFPGSNFILGKYIRFMQY